MKLVSFIANGSTRIGVIDGDELVDLLAVHGQEACFDTAQLAALGDMISLIANWDSVKAAVGHCVASSGQKGIGRQPLAA